nr:EamA family transporter [uncultured Oscillibacter sp.]
MPMPFIFLIIVVCVVCYTGQTFFNKLFSLRYQGPESAATPVYAVLYGALVSAVTLCLVHFQVDFSGETVLLGCLNGVVLFLYNLGMIHASRTGPYAFQSIVMLFGSIVVCLLFSAVYWGDRLTLLQIAGISVMLAAFVVLNGGGIDFRDVKRGYFLWVASLFFTNGIYGVLMDAQQRLHAQERNEMIIVTFLSSGVVSLLYLLLTQRGHPARAFRMGGAAWGLAVGSGLCAAFAVYTLMTLLAYIPGYILYTVCNGSLLVLSAILCRIVLKEKMTKMTLAGIALSVISIILLSI